jgi:serine/threonine protein kinase
VGIIVGMAFIHSKNIIHRYLKPSNIFLDSHHRIKICDFWTSRFESIGVTQTAAVGTPFYMAPELYSEEYDAKVDVYSFGLILEEIVVGKRVFSPTLPMPQLYGKLQRGERPEVPTNLPPGLRKLITKCWDTDPENRPNFRWIIRDYLHPKSDFGRAEDGLLHAASYFIEWVNDGL